MARMRYVKPTFWTDSRMIRLSRDARLFYIGTWNFALCDKGHLEDDPVQLKMQIFPADPVDVVPLMDELITCGRLVRITDGKDTWLQITTLEAHQKVDSRWTPRCPACKASTNLSQTQESLGEAPTSKNATKAARNSATTANLSQTLPNSPQEGRGGEGREEENSLTRASKRASSSADADGLFEKFWSVVPRKVGKKAARRRWDKAIKEVSPDTIIAAMSLYAASVGNTDPQFVAHPDTWLNQGRWDDEVNYVMPSARSREAFWDN